VKSQLVRGGERTRIIRKNFSSVPADITFEVAPVEGEGPVGGTVEVWGSSWVFPRQPQIEPLLPRTTVAKRYWDTFFSVYVVPDRDVMVTSAGITRPIYPFVVAGVLALVAAAVVVLAFLS